MGNCSCKYIFLKVLLKAVGIFFLLCRQNEPWQPWMYMKNNKGQAKIDWERDNMMAYVRDWYRLLIGDQCDERNWKVLGLCVTGQKCDRKHFCACVCMVLCVACCPLEHCLLLWDSVSPLPRLYQLGYTGWPSSFKDPPGSTSQFWDYKHVLLCLKFLPVV